MKDRITDGSTAMKIINEELEILEQADHISTTSVIVSLRKEYKELKSKTSTMITDCGAYYDVRENIHQLMRIEIILAELENDE